MNLIKNSSNDSSSIRINVRTITSISEITNIPIKAIEINASNLINLNKIKDLISAPGETDDTLKINNNSKIQFYKLSKKRKIDQNIILKLKNTGVALKIH